MVMAHTADGETNMMPWLLFGRRRKNFRPYIARGDSRHRHGSQSRGHKKVSPSGGVMRHVSSRFKNYGPVNPESNTLFPCRTQIYFTGGIYFPLTATGRIRLPNLPGL
jgi:hypothetical protein